MRLDFIYTLRAPLLLGFVARMLNATLGPGFHARDDYFHLLAPALGWLANPNFDWLQSDLPAAGARSFLGPKLIYAFLLVLRQLGLQDPETILRCVHAALGTYSLLTIAGVYLLSKTLTDNKQTIAIATWLSALHFAMPYAGTRLLIEAMAMPPLVFGLAYVAKQRLPDIAFGGFLIAVACWFRFQIGIAAIGLAVGLFWMSRNQDLPGAKRFNGSIRQVLALALGGGLGVFLQGIFDYVTTHAFLGPVLENFKLNLSPHEELTRSGTFSYLFIFAALTLPPVTVVIAQPLWRAFTRHWVVAFPLAFFVVSHSLIGHKEERFMLPVLPLFLLLLACIPEEISRPGAGIAPWVKSWWRKLIIPILLIHALGLLVTVGSQSQKNQRDAMSWLRTNHPVQHVVSFGPEIPAFLLARDDVNVARKRRFNPVWVFWTMWEMRQKKDLPVHVLSFEPQRAEVAHMLATSTLAIPEHIRRTLKFAPAGWDCTLVAHHSGWWGDRLIYRVNPRHNLRRSPIDIWQCFWPRPG